MKIISIAINPETEILEYKLDNVIIQGVILETKNWFGKTKKVKAFPTSNVYRNYKTNMIVRCCFVDELGKELDHDVEEQITNFLHVHFVNKKQTL